MARHLSPEYFDWIRRGLADGLLSALADESEVLRVHHGELGVFIAQHWELPERIVQAFIHHHTPGEGRDIVCDAVHVANLVAYRFEIRHTAPAPEADSLERLGLEGTRLEQLIVASRSRFESVCARYNAT